MQDYVCSVSNAGKVSHWKSGIEGHSSDIRPRTSDIGPWTSDFGLRTSRPLRHFTSRSKTPDRRILGLVPASAIVISSMIGTGIFTTSGLMVSMGAGGGDILMGWLIGGLIALCGALCYGEVGGVPVQFQKSEYRDRALDLTGTQCKDGRVGEDAKSDLPPRRTGRADFPHPALPTNSSEAHTWSLTDRPTRGFGNVCNS